MKAAGYSESYIGVEILPFTTDDKISRLDSWESINSADVAVSATLGTTFERHVKLWFPNAEIKIVEAPALGHLEVIAGRADVFVTSNIEGATLVEKFPQARQIPVEAPRSRTPIAMLLPQTDQVWINYINNWIKLKTTQGFFDEVAARWGL